jgi:glycosyltransferase involved in cell wall biosynthesis
LSGQVRKLITPPVRGVAAFLAFPDVARGWILSAAATARAVLRQGEFDVVISSGPPHSGHVAAYLATLGRREGFWMDMRDPWGDVEGPRNEHGFRTRSHWFARRLQVFLFRRASRIIANTKRYAEELLAFDPSLPVVWLPNGIDYERLPPRCERRFQQASVACIGTLYLRRNLTSVLTAMAELVCDRPELAEALTLRVAGHRDPAQQLQLETDIAALGLENMVELYGVVPLPQALDILGRSHLAIVAAQEQPLQVPAKLYESVGMGVPTVVLAESDSSSANEARRIGAMVVDPADVAGMRELLERIADGECVDNTSPSGALSYEDLASTMDRFLRGSSAREMEIESAGARPATAMRSESSVVRANAAPSSGRDPEHPGSTHRRRPPVGRAVPVRRT